jgi:hypothetical protein
MPRIGIAIVGGALGLALLAGCETVEEQIDRIAGDGDDEPRTVAFDCAGDEEMTVRLSGDRDHARVAAGGEQYELEHTGSDDGRRLYTNDDDVRLEISNDDAYLRIPGGDDYRDCERS